MSILSPPSRYAYIWHKYRPVVIKLMIDAAEAPQQYQFFEQEFRRFNRSETNGYSFILYVNSGNALNNIKTSALANDLLLLLRSSKTAALLMQSSTFEFMLDAKFILHVRKAKNEIKEKDGRDSLHWNIRLQADKNKL